MGERAKLPSFRPAATVEADVTATRASRPYKASEGCDPQHITAKTTREACEAFRKLEGELATAQEAGRLEAAANVVRARLGRAPAAVEPDPQASAFSTLTGVPVATSAALYAFWLSLAFELGAMFAMMLAYSNAAPPVAVGPEATTQRPSPETRLAVVEPIAPVAPPRRSRRPVALIETGRVPGDVAKFAVAALTPPRGPMRSYWPDFGTG
jgi:hypothetical protein